MTLLLVSKIDKLEVFNQIEHMEESSCSDDFLKAFKIIMEGDRMVITVWN